METKSITATLRALENEVRMRDHDSFEKSIRRILKSGVKLLVLEIGIKLIVAEKSQVERLKKLLRFEAGSRNPASNFMNNALFRICVFGQHNNHISILSQKLVQEKLLCGVHLAKKELLVHISLRMTMGMPRRSTMIVTSLLFKKGSSRVCVD